MGVTIAVTRVACNTATGNQDITTADLGGLTPKAAFFTITRATSDGTAADHYVLGIGASTATDARWAFCIRSEHGETTTDSSRTADTDECAKIIDPTDGSVDGEADFVSFITNGVRINWADAPASAYLLTVTLFAGTDLSAEVSNFTADADEDGAVDVADVGFEPDVVLFVSRIASMDGSTSHAILTHGVAINKSPVVQASWMQYLRDAQASADPRGYITGSYALNYQALWSAEISGFDADGFTCTSRLGGGAYGIGYLALAFNGAVDFWAGTLDTPTSTGNQAVASPGFTPQFVHVGVTQMPALDTHYTDGNAGSIGIGVFDADDEYCNSGQDEDAEATTDTQSLSDDTCVNLPNDDGTQAHVASFVSFDANGWTWNFSATEGTAVKYWALAIEEEVGRIPRPPAAYYDGPTIF